MDSESKNHIDGSEFVRSTAEHDVVLCHVGHNVTRRLRALRAGQILKRKLRATVTAVD